MIRLVTFISLQIGEYRKKLKKTQFCVMRSVLVRYADSTRAAPGGQDRQNPSSALHVSLTAGELFSPFARNTRELPSSAVSSNDPVENLGAGSLLSGSSLGLFVLGKYCVSCEKISGVLTDMVVPEVAGDWNEKSPSICAL